MGFQQFDFVVDPEYFDHTVIGFRICKINVFIIKRKNPAVYWPGCRLNATFTPKKNKITVIVLKTEKSRIDAVDALRGFAVMAILLVHSLEHFIFPVYPASSPAWLAALDEGVFAVVFALFAGKAYATFALLFGFTFHLQYASRQSRGEDFGGRFLWRLLLLAGFATLNAAFFPAGDVLLLFSLVGVVLFAVRRLNDRTVLALALLFLAQPVEWYHCFRALADPGFAPPDLGVGAMYGEVAAYTKAGGFLAVRRRERHARAEGESAVGRQCRTVQPDGGPFPAGSAARPSRAFLGFGGQCALLGADADRRGRCLRAAPGPARAFRRSDGGPHGCDRARHVAETCLHGGACGFVRAALPHGPFPPGDRRPALLRADEPYQLYRAVRRRRPDLFPVRTRSRFPVRICAEPGDRRCGLRFAGGFLPLVAARPPGRGPLESLWHRLTWLGAK